MGWKQWLTFTTFSAAQNDKMSTPASSISTIATTEYATLVLSVEVVAWSRQKARVIRIRMIDGSFLDVRVTNSGDYSYHWEHRMTDGGIHRWDNAPHHSQVSTHPHHLHDGNEATIVESALPATSVDADIRYVLSFISNLIRSDARRR